jgi:lysophospholipase L1-like esterase
MRIRTVLAAAGAAALLAPAVAQARPATTYYVALGDSLSVGIQPNAAGASVETSQGYANQLFGLERGRHPGLVLAKLGCGGETTTSMMVGGKCQYSGDHRLGYSHRRKGNQLQAAQTFLREHRGHVAFVTIDVGANDVQGCSHNGQINGACLNAGIASIKRNIPKISRALRSAGGSGLTIVGMNLYDPFLALWLDPNPSVHAVAEPSAQLAKNVNKSISDAFRHNGIRKVADVAAAFKTYDGQTTVTFRGQQVPLNVERICRLTWMCAPRPRGPNIHANRTGYGVIARVFEPLV